MCPGDGYTNITGECDLFEGGCAAGHHCVAQATASDVVAVCEPSSGGPNGAGEPCVDDAACQDAMICNGGLCHPYCCPETNEPCGANQCNLQLNFTGTDKYAMVCAYNPTCQLFTPGSCAEGTDCHVADEVKGIAVCHEPAEPYVDPPEPCAFVNNCGDSQYCSETCFWHCDVSTWDSERAPAPGLGGCPEGTECVLLNGWDGFPNLGSCQPL